MHTVYGLYNDDMKPPDYLGKTFASDHKHYLTTLGTTLDSLHIEGRHFPRQGAWVREADRSLRVVDAPE